MPKFDVDRSRELRHWITDIITPAVIVTAAALSVEEVREGISNFGHKIYDTIAKNFKK